MESVEDPKLFISYSWTSPDHEDWVLNLATELRDLGVDVILDKWDLKEGHDAHAFMERMVTDPEIKKVLLICDKAYADKADGRSGGVGTEAQIISAEIYSKQDQDKFVAVVRERDEDGSACVPAYYRSRIHIDLSDPSTYAENFERLLRWVYDKPLYKKPELGQRPSFLVDDEKSVSLATSVRFKLAVDAVKKNRENASAAVAEYFTTLTSEFEKLRLDKQTEHFDDAVVQSIESFLPYRNEAIEMFLTLALYQDNEETRRALHRFFEGLIPFSDRSQQVTQWSEWDFDNFRFIIHELFLYAVAALIRYERFESAAYLMQTEYYVPGQSVYGRDVMVSYYSLRQHMQALEHRNKRLKLNRLSLRAGLLNERCKGVGLEFRHIMQADFILFLRGELDQAAAYLHWWPETLLYVREYSGPFEVFARSRSASFFEKSKVLLGIQAKEDLESLLEGFRSGERRLPRWQMNSFSVIRLLGFDELATKP